MLKMDVINYYDWEISFFYQVIGVLFQQIKKGTEKSLSKYHLDLEI